MAVADVKAYFKKVEKQYRELKDNMKDFDEAFAKGYITEDRLTEVKKWCNVVETNYERLAYIMHLLAIPNKHGKKLTKADEKLRQSLSMLKADENYVLVENQDALVNFRKEVEKLLNDEE